MSPTECDPVLSSIGLFCQVLACNTYYWWSVRQAEFDPCARVRESRAAHSLYRAWVLKTLTAAHASVQRCTAAKGWSFIASGLWSRPRPDQFAPVVLLSRDPDRDAHVHRHASKCGSIVMQRGQVCAHAIAQCMHRCSCAEAQA